MNRQDIREEMQLDPELFKWFCKLLFDGKVGTCNPDFLVMDVTGAIAGKVFTYAKSNYPSEVATVAAWVTAKKMCAEIAIRCSCEDKITLLTGKYKDKEQKTFYKQQAAYEVYVKDGTVVPYMQMLATTSGVPINDIMSTIGNKIAEYDAAVFSLLGEQKKSIAAL